MTDDMERLVAQPLRSGGRFCVLHARPFVVRPAPVIPHTEAMVIVFLDLESWAQRTYAVTSDPSTGRYAQVKSDLRAKDYGRRRDA